MNCFQPLNIISIAAETVSEASMTNNVIMTKEYVMMNNVSSAKLSP